MPAGKIPTRASLTFEHLFFLNKIDFPVGEVGIFLFPGLEGALSHKIGIGMKKKVSISVNDPCITCLSRANVFQKRGQKPGDIDVTDK